jgi:hypothetical protein
VPRFRLTFLGVLLASACAGEAVPPSTQPAAQASVVSVAVVLPSVSPGSAIAAEPVPVAAPILPESEAVVSFGLGLDYWCALTVSHAVACWNGNDRPATAGYVADLPPVDVLHVGEAFACARAMADQGLYCWGVNYSGQLGTGAADPPDNEPYHPAARHVLDAHGQPLVARDFLVGSSHACALLGGGDVVCWGSSVLGESGVRPSHDGKGRWIPVLHPTTVFHGAVKLFGGDATSCAVSAKDELSCWGDQDGGYSGSSATFTPRHITVPGPVVAMSFGSGHSCLLTDGPGVYCRGWNPGGQLGSAGRWQHPLDGKGAHDSDFRAPFTRVPEFTKKYASVSASRSETCAVTAPANLECIGTPEWTGARATVVDIPGPTASTATARPSSTSPPAPLAPMAPVTPANRLLQPQFEDAVTVAAAMGRRCVLDHAGVVHCQGGAPYSHVDEPTPTALRMPAR